MMGDTSLSSRKQVDHVNEIEYNDLESTSREFNPLEFSQGRDAWNTFHPALSNLCRWHRSNRDREERSEFQMNGRRGHSSDTDVKWLIAKHAMGRIGSVEFKYEIDSSQRVGLFPNKNFDRGRSAFAGTNRRSVNPMSQQWMDIWLMARGTAGISVVDCHPLHCWVVWQGIHLVQMAISSIRSVSCLVQMICQTSQAGVHWCSVFCTGRDWMLR
jgi:hypothetical protein